MGREEEECYEKPLKLGGKFPFKVRNINKIEAIDTDYILIHISDPDPDLKEMKDKAGRNFFSSAKRVRR